MSRVLMVMFIVSLLIVPPVFPGEGKSIKQKVRDSSGKLLYMTTTRGNQTEVRDPSGKLLVKSKTFSDGRTETRSPSGKLINKSK